VVTGDQSTYRGGEAHSQLGALLDLRDSLIVSDGETHRRRRRLMLPPFHGDRVQAYTRLIGTIAARHVEAWPTDRPFALLPRLQALSLDVILRAVLGLRDEKLLDRFRDRVNALIGVVAGPTAFFLLLPWLRRDWGPASPWGRAVRVTRTIKDLLACEIARARREGTSNRTDVLAMLVESRDEQGRHLGDRDIEDELLTLLVAGHETTATAIAWTCYHVLVRPRVRDLLLRELAGRPNDAGPRYLDAVIKEAARLSPVITEVSRLLGAPADVGERRLPAGVVATPCIYLVHRRADVWENPLAFVPERFLDARPSPFVFLPFGGGERRCLGAAFASHEMKIVLGEMFSRRRLALRPRYDARPVRRSITLAPSRGLPVTAAVAGAR
jgi:cytochrome P450